MRQLVAGSVVGILCLTAPAGARDGSWYLDVEAGVDIGRYSAETWSAGTGAEDGLALLATLGTRVMPHALLEGELSYRQIDMPFNTDLQQTSLMLNVLYELPVTKDLSLDFGLGAGIDRVTFSGGDEATFAYQFKGGLSFALSERMHVVADYRYMNTTSGLIGGGPPSFAWINDVDNRTVTVGLRFDL